MDHDLSPAEIRAAHGRGHVLVSPEVRTMMVREAERHVRQCGSHPEECPARPLDDETESYL